MNHHFLHYNQKQLKRYKYFTYKHTKETFIAQEHKHCWPQQKKKKHRKTEIHFKNMKMFI